MKLGRLVLLVRKLYIVLLLVILLIIGVAWGWPTLNRFLYPVAYVTVDEIWDHPEAWQGQRIVVRGWSALTVNDPGTQNECFPNLCQCVLNETDFFLTAGNQVEKIRIRDVECMGAACPRMCVGRDTIAPQAYELVGTLQVRRGAMKSLCYWTIADLKANPNIVSRYATDFISQAVCRNKYRFVQQAWTPLNTYYARPYYSLELTDVELTLSKRLVGLGGLAGLSAEPVSDAEFVAGK